MKLKCCMGQPFGGEQSARFGVGNGGEVRGWLARNIVECARIGVPEGGVREWGGGSMQQELSVDFLGVATKKDIQQRVLVLAQESKLLVMDQAMKLRGEVWISASIMLGHESECTVHGFTPIIVPIVAGGGSNRWGAGGPGGVGEHFGGSE